MIPRYLFSLPVFIIFMGSCGSGSKVDGNQQTLSEDTLSKVHDAIPPKPSTPVATSSDAPVIELAVDSLNGEQVKRDILTAMEEKFQKNELDSASKIGEASILPGLIRSDANSGGTYGYVVVIEKIKDFDCCPSAHKFYIYFVQRADHGYVAGDEPLVIDGSDETYDRKVVVTIDYPTALGLIKIETTTDIPTAGVKGQYEANSYTWADGRKAFEIFLDHARMGQ